MWFIFKLWCNHCPWATEGVGQLNQRNAKPFHAPAITHGLLCRRLSLSESNLTFFRTCDVDLTAGHQAPQTCSNFKIQTVLNLAWVLASLLSSLFQFLLIYLWSGMSAIKSLPILLKASDRYRRCSWAHGKVLLRYSCYQPKRWLGYVICLLPPPTVCWTPRRTSKHWKMLLWAALPPANFLGVSQTPS